MAQVNQIEEDTVTENGMEDVDIVDEHGNLSTVKRKRIVFGKLKCVHPASSPPAEYSAKDIGYTTC